MGDLTSVGKEHDKDEPHLRRLHGAQQVCPGERPVFLIFRMMRRQGLSLGLGEEFSGERVSREDKVADCPDDNGQ